MWFWGDKTYCFTLYKDVLAQRASLFTTGVFVFLVIIFKINWNKKYWLFSINVYCVLFIDWQVRINALNTLYQFPLSDELTSKNSEGIRKGLLAALADGDEHLAVCLKTLFFQILQTLANKPLTPVIHEGPSTCKEQKKCIQL